MLGGFLNDMGVIDLENLDKRKVLILIPYQKSKQKQVVLCIGIYFQQLLEKVSNQLIVYMREKRFQDK